MLRLPPRFAAIILCFAPLFFQRSWRHAEMLLIGAILTPGRRTVTSILRITGLGRERRFVNYHRVLSRAAWSGRAAARVLLGLLLDAFVPRGPVILGLDDTVAPGYEVIDYIVRIGGNGTPEQFEAIHRTVMQTSPNYFNMSRPIRMNGQLQLDRA